MLRQDRIFSICAFTLICWSTESFFFPARLPAAVVVLDRYAPFVNVVLQSLIRHPEIHVFIDHILVVFGDFAVFFQ